MCLHLANNPVVTEEWKDLWPKLQDHGWRAVDVKVENVKIDGLHPATRVIYAYSPETVIEPIPGVHIFASKIALTRFIARYPYLLQNDTIFTQTLLRHGWTRDKKDTVWKWPSSNNRLVCCW
jgi:hypothetical protein